MTTEQNEEMERKQKVFLKEKEELTVRHILYNPLMKAEIASH